MGSYIVIVRMPHLQPAITLRGIGRVAIARNVSKGIAASPFFMSAPGIFFHRITFGEVVP